MDSIVTKLETGASLFVSSKKRVFFTNIEKLDGASVEKALSRAKKSIVAISPKKDYRGIARALSSTGRRALPTRG